MAVAAVIALQVGQRERARVLGSIPSGWRNVPFQRQTVTLQLGDDLFVVTYRFSRDGIEIAVDGREVAVDALYGATSETVDMAIGGVRRTYLVHVVAREIYIHSTVGSGRFRIVPRFPETDSAVVTGEMVAKTPGTVVAVPVSVGDFVETGDTVIVVEAMKMEQAVVASEPGRVVAVYFAVGDQVDAGSVLIEIEPGDHSG
jgi:propionyl-CoA carboxylase alpha chain